MTIMSTKTMLASAIEKTTHQAKTIALDKTSIGWVLYLCHLVQAPHSKVFLALDSGVPIQVIIVGSLVGDGAIPLVPATKLLQFN